MLEVARTLPAQAYKRVRWREGSKGVLASRFARVRVWPAHGYWEGRPPESEQWLLVEWPEDAAEPTKYWLATLPHRTSFVHLMRVAKTRWRVEQDYQQLKEELGLDHFEGRSWPGWHHHVTLIMVAYGFLVRPKGPWGIADGFIQHRSATPAMQHQPASFPHAAAAWATCADIGEFCRLAGDGLPMPRPSLPRVYSHSAKRPE